MVLGVLGVGILREDTREEGRIFFSFLFFIFFVFQHSW